MDIIIFCNEFFGIVLLKAFNFMFAGFNVDVGTGTIGDLYDDVLVIPIDAPNFAVVNDLTVLWNFATTEPFLESFIFFVCF